MEYDFEYRTEWPGGFTFGDRAVFRKRRVSVLKYSRTKSHPPGQVPISHDRTPGIPFFVPADDLLPQKAQVPEP
jgi:hypothetical protein